MSRRLRNLATGFVLTGMTLAAAFAPAQQDGTDLLNKKISVLNYQRTDVREALNALFAQVGANFSISQEVQGQVEGRLADATFEQGLLFILRQVGATYRLEAGIFQIIPREIQDPVGGTPPPDTGPTTTRKIVRRIKLRSADPQLIALLLGSNLGQQSFIISPELSQLSKLPQGGQGGQGGGGGFGGGQGGGGFGGGQGGGGFGGGGGGFGGGGGGFGGGGGGGGFGGGGGGFGGGGGGFR